jgi:hypothetical protein
MYFVLCTVLALAAPPPAPEIIGKVVDYDGKAVSGVTVSVVSGFATDSDQAIKRTVSDPNGNFSFTDLGRGPYGIVARTNSACAISDTFGVSFGATRVMRLQLIKGLCQSPLRFAQPSANQWSNRSGQD